MNNDEAKASLQRLFASITGRSNTSHDHGAEHLWHCFDYLRQAVMCAGDMALEEAIAIEDGESPTRVTQGWGTSHQCRNWQMMYDFAASHRYRNSSGIL
jgi:hypothetical protein